MAARLPGPHTAAESFTARLSRMCSTKEGPAQANAQATVRKQALEPLRRPQCTVQDFFICDATCRVSYAPHHSWSLVMFFLSRWCHVTELLKHIASMAWSAEPGWLLAHSMRAVFCYFNTATSTWSTDSCSALLCPSCHLTAPTAQAAQLAQVGCNRTGCTAGRSQTESHYMSGLLARPSGLVLAQPVTLQGDPTTRSPSLGIAHLVSLEAHLVLHETVVENSLPTNGPEIIMHGTACMACLQAGQRLHYCTAQRRRTATRCIYADYAKHLSRT